MTRIHTSTRLEENAFITRIAPLAHLCGISPEATALFIHTGRSARLAGSIIASLSPAPDSALARELDAFLLRAQDFTPPESLECIRREVYHALARARRTPDAEACVFIPGEADAMRALTRLVRLTTALHYPPRVIALLLHAGRFAPLVDALYTDNRLRTSAANVRELDALAAIAGDFVLPERYLQSPELLSAQVERLAGV